VFSIVIEKSAREYLGKMQKKTRRILVDKILELQYNPYPEGNKERLDYPHPPVVYRLHVSRSFTVFSIIKEDERTIRVEKIMTIEQAHKEYRRR
jgi:mRNA-degrading endonuclease RelE of RelBE toxin-antitoxin system